MAKTFQVYGLYEPAETDILNAKFIGCTKLPLNKAVAQHIQRAKMTGWNQTRVSAWIHALLASGKRPLVKVLVTIADDADLCGRSLALAAQRAVITEVAKRSKHRLLNQAMTKPSLAMLCLEMIEKMKGQIS